MNHDERKKREEGKKSEVCPPDGNRIFIPAGGMRIVLGCDKELECPPASRLIKRNIHDCSITAATKCVVVVVVTTDRSAALIPSLPQSNG